MRRNSGNKILNWYSVRLTVWAHVDVVDGW